MGSNGLESYKYTNHFSVNILAGLNGGLQGVEIGSLVNVLKGDMCGAQIAGLLNTVWGNSNGVQFAGMLNVSRKYFFGGQFAGFANTVLDSAAVNQFAGFVNVVRWSNSGSQFAGFSNFAGGDLKGVQASGFTNLVHGNVSGGQLSGFVNSCTGNVQGPQIAGFVNVALGEVNGIQAAGFVNVARRVSGVQLGFLNIADSVENGIPIGFLSIVRNGYSRFEVTTGESFYAALNFKIGVERFYNIFSIGVKPAASELYWGWGYGVGTLIPISPKFSLNLDATAHQINEGTWVARDLNLLSRTHLGLSYKPGNRFELFGGPSLNVLVADALDAEGLPRKMIMKNYAWKQTRYDTFVGIYPGINLGMRF